MPAVTAERMLEAMALKREKFPLDKWGCAPDEYVVIQEMPLQAFLQLHQKHGDKPDTADEGFQWALLRYCLADDDGNLLFDPSRNGHATVNFLAKKPGLVMAIANRALEICGIETRTEGEPEKN